MEQSKYIIKNCPALRGQVCTELFIKLDIMVDCQDCTDCVMKQIVELCRHSKEYSDCGRDCSSFGSFLNKLLDKLDIQEVE